MASDLPRNPYAFFAFYEVNNPEVFNLKERKERKDDEQGQEEDSTQRAQSARRNAEKIRSRKGDL